MIEEFKSIIGEEGFRVSNLGQVWSQWVQKRLSTGGGNRIKTKYWFKVRQQTHKQGYKFVYLNPVDGKQVKSFVHRLVAVAFIPNPDNLPCVCHKDDLTFNNNKDNLFWGTHKDNMDNRDSKGKMPKGEKHSSHKLKDIDIRTIRSSTLINKELADFYGVSRETIRSVRANQTWKHLCPLTTEGSDE